MTYTFSGKQSRNTLISEMAFGVDGGNQESLLDSFPRRKDAIQILDTCINKHGDRYYKIRWKDSWEREEDCLVASCERLIQEFWDNEKRYVMIQKYGSSNSYDENESVQNFKLPSPTPTSGRRKGKPKKFVNHAVVDGDRVEDDKMMSYIKGGRDINGNIENHHAVENEKHIHQIQSEVNKVSQPIEEYPVMIIRDHDGPTVDKEPPSAIQDVTCEVHSPCHTSMNTHIINEPYTKRLRFEEEEPCTKKSCYTNDASYVDEIPRISKFKSIISNSDSNSRLKYVSSNTKSEEYSLDSKVSPVYVNTHQVIQPVVTIPSNFSVIKSCDRYTVSEGMPIVYGISASSTNPSDSNVHYILDRPHHLKEARPIKDKHSDNNPHPSDRQHLQKKTEKRFTLDGIPLPLSPPKHKFETSKLLLKVTTPGALSGTTFITPASHRNTQQFPIYQNNTFIKTVKYTKEDTKLKSSNIIHKIVDGEQRPQCSECFQTFKKRAALERHMMIHRGIKPFQCHFCNQRFRQKHHLQGHIMLHTGERPHSCTLCNKKFRMRHHLLEHERISHKVFR